VGEQGEKQLVVIGLGNPGTRYEMTRHNMGAIVVQGFARTQGVAFKADNRFLAKTAKKSVQGSTVHLILPATYMNESGKAVRMYIDYYKLTPLDILVVSDDADLPFGALRLRSQGSSGGHNGLKSIERNLGTSKYPRLRIGIGREDESRKELSDFVLDRFTKNEESLLFETVESGIKVLNMLLSEPLENVMNVINTSVKEEKQNIQEKNPKNTSKGDKQEEKS
jgi:PTH1 family peptidyl-tRNA hydrolase